MGNVKNFHVVARTLLFFVRSNLLITRRLLTALAYGASVVGKSALLATTWQQRI
jgi:hypothetical protein